MRERATSLSAFPPPAIQKTSAMTGKGGGVLAELADVLIAIPCGLTLHIQEAGMVGYHCLCEQVEQALFGQLHRSTEQG